MPKLINPGVVLCIETLYKSGYNDYQISRLLKGVSTSGVAFWRYQNNLPPINPKRVYKNRLVERELIKNLVDAGKSVKEIAEQTGLKHTTIYYHVNYSPC